MAQEVLNSYSRINNQMLLEAYQLGYNAGIRQGIEQTRAEFTKADMEQKEASKKAKKQ